jgi:hypothetical protein
MSFSGCLERRRSGRLTPGSSLAQPKISGGKKGADILDYGINFFLMLHVRLLKRKPMSRLSGG